ncbi:MAG: glycosyltransferase [Anaerolineales bacterium]
MRIAYVSLHWPRTRHSGVGKKLSRQISLWQAGGHEARLFMHTSRYEPAADLVPAEVIPYDSAGRLGAELARSRAARRLIAALRAWHPDVIYLRLAMYVYPVHRLAEIAPLVGEANTNDLTQHEGLGKIYAIYNRLTRGLLLRRLDGLVAVSRELAESPAFASFHKPTRVIANGIDLETFAPLPPPANTVPHVVFIGHPGYVWHGVDKLLALARRLPDIHFDVIGYETVADGGACPANVCLHGYLTEEAYLPILGRADAAISSLALHRIGLEEASPLKSRECLAYGLPLVMAYRDTDLQDAGCDCLLQIPNTADNVQTHAEAIRDFAYRMRGRRVDRACVAVIDQPRKEAERLAFFEDLISRRKGTGR